MKDGCKNHNSLVKLFFEQVQYLYEGGLVFSPGCTVGTGPCSISTGGLGLMVSSREVFVYIAIVQSL